jgi:hypothetical protein
MKYIPFTEEEKQRANSVDLVDFLQRQGEQLTRAGRDWRWKRHDSVTIRGNRWYRYSREQGGLAIDKHKSALLVNSGIGHDEPSRRTSHSKNISTAEKEPKIYGQRF